MSKSGVSKSGNRPFWTYFANFGCPSVEVRKMENNQQEIPVDCLIQIAKHFGTSVDDVIFFDEKNGVPNEVSMNDKAALEQLQLINELNEEEKGILL